MILLYILFGSLLFSFAHCNLNDSSFQLNGPLFKLNININDYKIQTFTEDGATKTVIHSISNLSNWTVIGTYHKSYLTTGWDTLDLEGNPNVPGEVLAYFAGYVEGDLTRDAIYDHWYNTVRRRCENQTEICNQVNHFLLENLNWIGKMVEEQKTDVYWQQVQNFYFQVGGIFKGYNSTAPKEKEIPLIDILLMNYDWDLGDLMSAFKNESNKALKGEDGCSAIIKILHGQSDVLVAHNTWTGYETMRRIMKRYTIPFKGVPGSSMSFSSYPGAIVSGDDFYIINSGLVVQETTNSNNNDSLWALVRDPRDKVLEVVRVMVANRLAETGRSWAKIFSHYNSGTYNNQWMIVDMKKFSRGSIGPNLLWVVEQMPGYIHQEDQTEELLRQGYWASYNIPFYPDIYSMSGHQELAQKYGDYFTHDKTPRAQIFNREIDKVKDVASLMSLMRYNDYQHDPLSKCDCTPPYSAQNAIASRSDLNPANGSYPFPVLSHRPHGATDAKVTSVTLSRNLSMLAVCGPTSGTNLPHFQWSLSDYDHKLSHLGHPDLFNFQPVNITWNDFHHQFHDDYPSVQLLP